MCIQFFKNFLKINVTDIKILRKMILRNFNRDRRKLRNKMEFNFEQQNYFPCFFEIEKQEEGEICKEICEAAKLRTLRGHVMKQPVRT